MQNKLNSDIKRYVDKMLHALEWAKEKTTNQIPKKIKNLPADIYIVHSNQFWSVYESRIQESSFNRTYIDMYECMTNSEAATNHVRKCKRRVAYVHQASQLT